jgi:uncharacterized protein (TIGR03435 family)
MAACAFRYEGQGQSSPDAFEVVAIKLHAGNSMENWTRPFPGGRLRVENQTLRSLIKTAFRVQDFQMSGGPSWINSERYDIEAKSKGNPPLSEVAGPMLQAILEDRFKLKTHREMKEMPVYELVASKKGPRLRPSQEEGCVQYNPNGTPPSPGEKKQPVCGSLMTQNGVMNATSIRMEDLVRSLSVLLDHPVIDKTNFREAFDAHLEFVPAEAMSGAPSGVAADPSKPAPAGPDNFGPSLITALREQMGLTLRPAKGPVKILTIDHVERPSEN